MIDCHGHGQVHGYIVCVHVMKGAPCTHFLPAREGSPEPALDLGEALCTACGQESDLDVNSVKLICEYCLAKFPNVSDPALPTHVPLH